MEPIKRLRRLSGKRSVYCVQVHRILIQFLELGLEKLRTCLQTRRIRCIVPQKRGELCAQYLQKHRAYVAVTYTISANRLKALADGVDIGRDRLFIEVDIISSGCSELASIDSNAGSIVTNQPNAVRSERTQDTSRHAVCFHTADARICHIGQRSVYRFCGTHTCGACSCNIVSTNTTIKYDIICIDSNCASGCGYFMCYDVLLEFQRRVVLAADADFSGSSDLGQTIVNGKCKFNIIADLFDLVYHCLHILCSAEKILTAGPAYNITGDYTVLPYNITICDCDSSAIQSRKRLCCAQLSSIRVSDTIPQTLVVRDLVVGLSLDLRKTCLNDLGLLGYDHNAIHSVGATEEVQCLNIGCNAVIRNTEEVYKCIARSTACSSYGLPKRVAVANISEDIKTSFSPVITSSDTAQLTRIRSKPFIIFDIASSIAANQLKTGNSIAIRCDQCRSGLFCNSNAFRIRIYSRQRYSFSSAYHSLGYSTFTYITSKHESIGIALRVALDSRYLNRHCHSSTGCRLQRKQHSIARHDIGYNKGSATDTARCKACICLTVLKLQLILDFPSCIRGESECVIFALGIIGTKDLNQRILYQDMRVVGVDCATCGFVFIRDVTRSDLPI